MITLMFRAISTMIWNPDASFATSFTGNVTIHIAMARLVIMMAQCGVSNLMLMSSNGCGSKLSRAIANKNREAAKTPESAPEIIVRTAKVAIARPTFVEATASTKATSERPTATAVT